MTILELEQNSTILCDLSSVCMDWSGVVMPFVDLGGYGKRLTPGSPRTFCRLNPCRKFSYFLPGSCQISRKSALRKIPWDSRVICKA